MSFGEQMKRKADEVHLQDKAKDFGDAVAELAKAAVGMVAGFAAENREKVDGALDKAEQKIGENTQGKHHETVTKVRAQVDKGLDKLVEQRDQPDTHTPAGSQAHAPGDPLGRPDAAWPRTQVPDDVHSAFDDDAPAGSPS